MDGEVGVCSSGAARSGVGGGYPSETAIRKLGGRDWPRFCSRQTTSASCGDGFSRAASPIIATSISCSHPVGGVQASLHLLARRLLRTLILVSDQGWGGGAGQVEGPGTERVGFLPGAGAVREAMDGESKEPRAVIGVVSRRSTGKGHAVTFRPACRDGRP
jgi:hypothetical protein